MTSKKGGLRLASRKDGNQTQIVGELRQLGYDVDIVHVLPGFVDLIVSGVATWSNERAVGVRVELKMPGAKLTKHEEKYWSKQLRPGNLMLAQSTEEILAWFGGVVRRGKVTSTSTNGG